MSEEENINQSPDDNHASTVENKTVDQLQNEKMEVQK